MQSINQAVSAALKARDNNQAYQQLVDHVLNDPEVHQFLAQNANSLTVETIERGYSKLYEFYRERELMRAGRATVAPGVCAPPRTGQRANRRDLRSDRPVKRTTRTKGPP